MKKILASDIDGTLLFDGILHDSDKQSILRLMKQNYLFGVSTGRSYNGVKFIKEEYGIDLDFYVLLNGALVMDKYRKILKHEVIPYFIIEEIYNKYSNCKFLGLDGIDHTAVLIGHGEFTWDNIIRSTINEVENGKYSLISMDFSYLSAEEVDNVCMNINEKFNKYIVAYRNSYYIDVVPKGCSKGSGVNIISRNLNIDRDHIYVIGDSFNDVSMFEEFKNSFTLTHAEEKLKSYTNFVVDSVSECIEKYIICRKNNNIYTSN